MIYTFLYGIDAIFRINKSFLFHTTAYFLSWVISVVGWKFLKNNKSLLKTCLGFIFVPAFPLVNTLLCFGSYLSGFHKEHFLIIGGVNLFVLAVSLIFIVIKTKDCCGAKSGIQFFFIVFSGLMIFTHCCIELISFLENFAVGLVLFSVLLIAYYYLRVLIVRTNNADAEKSEKLNSISNVIFWIYIVIYDFAFFGMAASSV